MILLEIQCPHCNRKQKWLSYTVKKREQLFKKQTTCKVCGLGFLIKGAEVNRIIREVKYDGN